mgnify:CR=1 FL=1
MSQHKSPSKNKQKDSDDTSAEETSLSVLHILSSVLSAAIGVQNKKNQEKDFNTKGSIYIYIAAGVIFTALFVLTVALVVSTVLNSAT